MSDSNLRIAARRRPGWLEILTLLFIILSLACSLPTIGRPTPSPASPTQRPSPPPKPTPTQQPLPPALVESDPPLGGEVPLQGPVTLYFNQPMDRETVELALSLGESGGDIRLSWINDSTLEWAPESPLAPETDLTLNIDPSARSAQGLSLSQPLSLTYTTVGYLHLTQALPVPGAADVDPTSAVVAAFNRPVVPLGGNTADLPVAFTLDPAAPGRGEWINTSTYIFYPELALEGGKPYTVRIEPGLQGVDGSPLDKSVGAKSLPTEWSFTTAFPRLVSVEPAEGSQSVRLDTHVVLTFNQPMDPASVEANFSLFSPGTGKVTGVPEWNTDFTVFTFTPASPLARNTVYSLTLNSTAQARGGTPLGSSLTTTLQTVPVLSVLSSDPAQGGQLRRYGNVIVRFSAPILEKDILNLVTFTPSVPNLNYWWDEATGSLNLFGDFSPNTDYSLVLSPNFADPWGGTLGQPVLLTFHTAPLDPGLIIPAATDVLFLTPQDPGLSVQATNVFSVPISLGRVPLDDFIRMLGPNGYDFRNSYQPEDLKTWSQSLDLVPDRSQPVELLLSPDGSPLAPGLYAMRLNINLEGLITGPFLLVVGNVHLTLKVSATDVLVWAVDLRDNSPVPNSPVVVYGEEGQILASGSTDSEGVFRTEIPGGVQPYSMVHAVLGQPGQDQFGMALSNWNQGLANWDFGIPADFTPPQLEAYIYTDRPIYRPGQTIYFRAVVRQAYNGRYTLPDLSSLPLTLTGTQGEELAVFDLPLSAYGTGHGEYTLPAQSQPGYYTLHSTAIQNTYLSIQVAEYRKPEINLQVTFPSSQFLAGQTATAEVNARYFFDAPAGNVPIHWALYSAPSFFNLPGYQVGVEDNRWLEAFSFSAFPNPLGELVADGDAETAPDGTLALDLPTTSDNDPQGERRRYTLEVTARDESGLPVSARTAIDVNPAEFYIGAQPDSWVGRSGEETGFNVQLVVWNQNPAGVHSLRAEYQKVVWIRQDPPVGQPSSGPMFTPQYTLIGSTDFTTNEEGQARLAFAPPEPGTYQLSITGEGARTVILLWVGGPGQAVWPALPNQRLRLTADRDTYRPGDMAQVFVPNPFEGTVPALVTVERGIVLRHEVVDIDPVGTHLSFPLTEEDSPNVYVSVTLLGRDASSRPDFRQGYLSLAVEPVEQTLNVALTGQPERTGPGEEVTFEVVVTDTAGDPVEGEFSLSVVDLAVLALADPNAPDILPAFYAEQPLGVRTGLALAAYARRQAFLPAGGGGGGGDNVIPQVVRERFPDTAFWSAEIITGPDGKAKVSVSLPDTLTTWQVDARGLTADTRVGQAKTQVVATKELLVRPIAPRFLVSGDHVQLATLVQNNTAAELQVEVSIQADGFALDDPATTVQQINIPAQDRVRVEWWGTAQDVDRADLVFSARAAGTALQDSARPAQGDLPVLHYIAREAFRTSGTLDEGGERLELVSLPRSFKPHGGELQVELSPSLAAAMMDALDALENSKYDSTEQTLSRFLPNLETFRALQQFGIQSPELQARLDRTLNEGIERLLSAQHPDGGWSWWQEGESDPYITAYILFGLSRAQGAGISTSTGAIQRAVSYLQTGLPSPEMLTETWQLDRLAFEHFALAQVGSGDSNGAVALYGVRDQLSPWAQALLALTLDDLGSGNDQVRTLLSDLQSNAIRSATGVHWETQTPGWQNMITTLSNSAIVNYALAQQDPGAPLLTDAVRYLMAHRQADGGWSSTYSTSWTLIALAEVMKGTGELGGDFSFSAAINATPLANGEASGAEQLTPVTAQVPVANLYPENPNALAIQRESGPGRLYYTAALNVNRSVEDIAPLERGLSISRAYYTDGGACLGGDPAGDCANLVTSQAVQSAQTGERITARLALTLPQDVYYLVVEDYIPAGTEILNTSLKTSQQGEDGAPSVQEAFDPRRPFDEGWGWWYFHPAQVYDDRIAWAADYLPAGTYELTYTLVVLQPGEYRVLPAHAWQFYFPEVYGNSAGDIFKITP